MKPLKIKYYTANTCLTEIPVFFILFFKNNRNHIFTVPTSFNYSLKQKSPDFKS